MDIKKYIKAGVAFSLAVMLMGTIDTEAAPTTVSKRKAPTTASRRASSGPSVVKGEVKNYGDYLTTRMLTVKKGESQIAVEYPISGNEELVNAVRRYIVDLVDEKYKGSLTTPEQLLKSAIKSYSSKGSLGMSGETVNEKVVVVYNNDNIITYLGEGYSYMGGAHGMSFVEGRTFRVDGGESLTTAMLPSISSMRPYIIDGLCQSLEATKSDLEGLIMVDEIQYPEGAPYINDDGLVFHYGAYEIGPWSIGMPTSTVSWEAARDLLTGDAAAFVK